MKHPKCKLCLADIQIDTTLTNGALGRMYGVDGKSVGRHRKHIDGADVADNPDSFFGVPNEIITSRGKTVRMPDGSYEKISYSPAKLALIESLKYDDLERAIA